MKHLKSVGFLESYSIIMGARAASRQRRGWKGGFTLIELLVVISIIALLIAILLPTLSSARHSARNTQSLSNVRQLSIAANTYPLEHKGALPPRVDGTMFGWAGKAGVQGTGYFLLKPRERPLNEYLYGSGIPDDMETQITQAPNDNVAGAFGTSAGSLYEAAGSSYAANIGGNSLPWSYFGSPIYGIVKDANGGRDKYRNSLSTSIKIDAILNTSEFVVLGEEGAFFHGWSYRSPRDAPADRWWFAPDVPKWNTAFSDGHADLIHVLPGQTWGDGFRFSNSEPPDDYRQP